MRSLPCSWPPNPYQTAPTTLPTPSARLYGVWRARMEHRSSTGRFQACRVCVCSYRIPATHHKTTCQGADSLSR